MVSRLTRPGRPGPGTPGPLGRTAWIAAGLGALMALVLTAPAAWLAAAVDAWTDGRLQWRDPTGTVWNGQATLALGAGRGSRVQLALPQRLSWRLRPTLGGDGLVGVALTLQHPWLLPQPIQVRAQALGWASASVSLQPVDGQGPMQMQVPAAWLTGLGSPWNTLQPSGQLSIRVDRLSWRTPGADPSGLDASFRIQMLNIASRVSTVPTLGSYELDVSGGPVLVAHLTSRPGSALRLEGQGQWSPGRQVEFRGQASAAEGREEALSNLLNIIGRREGARSLIAFGPSGPATRPPAPTQ